MRSLIGSVILTILVALSSAAQAQSPIAYNPVCSNAVVASCTYKVGTGQLYAGHVANWTATALVLMLVDAAVVPTSAGPACTAAQIAANTCNFIRAYPLPAGAAAAPTVLDLDFMKAAGPLLFQNGFIMLCSSTGLSGGVMTYTASPNCTFDAETH